MAYYINLSAIDIDEYQKKLEKSDLLPSRMILKQNLAESFTAFKKSGIKNVFELQQLLKKKEKIQEYSKSSGLSEQYLAILIREINSLQPKPNNLKDFKGINDEVLMELEKLGIKNTFQLFGKVISSENRKKLAMVTGVAEKDILELTKLADLSRIRWVGSTFAQVLYVSEFDTVEKVANADFQNLHHAILKTNKEKNLYKGQIGLHDMKLTVNAAKELSLDIEY